MEWKFLSDSRINLIHSTTYTKYTDIDFLYRLYHFHFVRRDIGCPGAFAGEKLPPIPESVLSIAQHTLNTSTPTFSTASSTTSTSFAVI